MKKYCFLIGIVLVSGCSNQPDSSNVLRSDTLSKSKIVTDTATVHQTDDSIDTSTTAANGFQTFIRYNVNDTIVEDFNGDQINDKAFLQQSGDQRHLFIVDGQSSQAIKVGSDVSFKELGNNFDWVDFWGVTKDTITYEVEVVDGEVSGSKEVKLLYPSLVLIKEEVGGGVVSYREKAYKWIHQAD